MISVRFYLFLVNEIEGEQITGCKDKDQILDAMAAKFPNARFVLTLGSDGAVLFTMEKKKGFPGIILQGKACG